MNAIVKICILSICKPTLAKLVKFVTKCHLVIFCHVSMCGMRCTTSHLMRKATGENMQRLNSNMGSTLHFELSATRAINLGHDPSSPIAFMCQIRCKYPRNTTVVNLPHNKYTQQRNPNGYTNPACMMTMVHQR